MKAGKSGVVIQPNEPSHGLLWEYIDSDEMPPKKPLSVDEKEISVSCAFGFRRIFAQISKLRRD